MGRRVYAETWQTTLAEWSKNTTEHRVPIAVLQQTLQENPKNWTGGKGSYLTKILTGLGWISTRTKEGRVYLKEGKENVNGSNGGPNGTRVLDEQHTDIQKQTSALAKQIRSLSQSVHEITAENASLRGTIEIRDIEITKLHKKIETLKSRKPKPSSSHLLQEKINEQTKRATILQRQNDQAAIERDHFLAEIKKLKKQLEKVPAPHPKTKKTISGRVGPKTVRDLFEWLGINTTPRTIASGHNGTAFNISIDITDDEQIIRKISINDNARIKRRSVFEGSSHVYEQIHLDDHAADFLKVFKPYRRYSQGFTESAVIEACEILGDPLMVESY